MKHTFQWCSKDPSVLRSTDHAPIQPEYLWQQQQKAHSMHKHTFCSVSKPTQTIRLWIILRISSFGFLCIYFFVKRIYCKSYYLALHSIRKQNVFGSKQTSKTKCNSRVDNTTAFRQVQKILKKISCHLIFKYFTKIKSKAQKEHCFDSEIFTNLWNPEGYLLT